MHRFVVLLHQTPSGYPRGDHYDLMLEQGEVLWTWACERLPQPGEAVACERLPDHRLAYLDYEGSVSGDRGFVRRVDAGEFETIEMTPELVRVRLAGATLRGVLELQAKGESGRWNVRLLP